MAYAFILADEVVVSPRNDTQQKFYSTCCLKLNVSLRTFTRELLLDKPLTRGHSLALKYMVQVFIAKKYYHLGRYGKDYLLMNMDKRDFKLYTDTTTLVKLTQYKRVAVRWLLQHESFYMINKCYMLLLI